MLPCLLLVMLGMSLGSVLVVSGHQPVHWTRSTLHDGTMKVARGGGQGSTPRQGQIAHWGRGQGLGSYWSRSQGHTNTEGQVAQWGRGQGQGAHRGKGQGQRHTKVEARGDIEAGVRGSGHTEAESRGRWCLDPAMLRQSQGTASAAKSRVETDFIINRNWDIALDRAVLALMWTLHCSGSVLDFAQPVPMTCCQESVKHFTYVDPP